MVHQTSLMEVPGFRMGEQLRNNTCSETSLCKFLDNNTQLLKYSRLFFKKYFKGIRRVSNFKNFF
jgi:hypothetical protein